MSTHGDGDSRNDRSGAWRYLLGRLARRVLLSGLVILGVVMVVALLLVNLYRGDTKEKAYVADLKYNLRNVMTAQESYFVDNHTYAPSLEALGPKSFHASPGVRVAIYHGTVDGYAASATMRWTPIRCFIFVGRVTPPTAGQRPGEPRCWTPRPTADPIGPARRLLLSS